MGWLDGQVALVTGGRSGIEWAVEAAVSACGRLDIFFGNAGVFDRVVPLLEFPADNLSAAYGEWFMVNVKREILGARAACPS